MTSFTGFESVRTGLLANCDPNFPTDLHNWVSGECLHFDERHSHFGFVTNGVALLSVPHGTFSLCKGMYFSVRGAGKVVGGAGIVMSRHDHACFFHVGGPVESWGRLKYIDGCSDSLLIPPVKLGDPCLNLLYFPPGIDQTEHTHPSDRIGCVYAGRGTCVTPEGLIDLEPGVIFRIHANGLHKFRTLKGEPMTVIAYHPDSDIGPTDELHPMRSRTIIVGVSASDPSRAQYGTKTDLELPEAA